MSTSSTSSYSYHILQPFGDPAIEKLHDKNSRSRLVLLNKHSIFIVGAFRMRSSYGKTKALDEMNRWCWRHLCLCGGWTSTLWICDSFLQQDLSSGEISEILIILIDKSWWHTHMMIVVTQDNGLEHRGCVSGCCWLPRSHDPDRKLCSLLPQVGI